MKGGATVLNRELKCVVNVDMTNKFIIRIILILMIIANCTTIFCFSAQGADKSNNSSGRVVNAIIETLPNTKYLSNEEKEQVKEKITKPIRKLAHFSIYTSLGFWLFALFKTYKIKAKLRVVYSWILGFLYACSDEIHQKFVGGRSSEITDVLIDSLGVLFGIFISFIMCKFVIKILENKKKVIE